MIYLRLFQEFFKIGIFSFGGGYSTIPFLYNISIEHQWYSVWELTHMIAISSITPGPVGINMATFAGMKTSGFCGALIATFAEVLPAIILIPVIAKFFCKYKDNFYIQSIISSLKPICCALLIAVVINLLKNNITDYKGLILLLILILLSIKIKKNPVFYIVISALAGIFL